jgi:hypothetical protein
MGGTRKKKAFKEMEYEDAPSGFVRLYNYKEPYVPFSGGYGYEGVLMFDGKSDKVMCNLCGKWFPYLPKHLSKEHAMKAAHYKELVGLGKNTALIGETIRTKMLKNGESRFRNLVRPNKGQPRSDETKERIRHGLLLFKGRMEAKNSRSTCPLQLLEGIRRTAEKLGRTPSADECSQKEAILFTYGDYGTAVKLAGLKPGLKPGQNFAHARGRRYTDEELVSQLAAFISAFGRDPHWSDFQRGVLPHRSVYSRRFGSIRKAVLLAKREAAAAKGPKNKPN